MTAGNVVSRHYDSLLVKVVCKADTFLHAVQKMQRSLYEFHIRGVKTNILFLENVLRHPEFLSGGATTSFIERHPALFAFSTDQFASSKLLTYLADVVVNGAAHPGAVGPPPAKRAPEAPRPPLLNGGSAAAAAAASTSTSSSTSSSSKQTSSPLYAPPPAGWKDVLSARGPEGWAAAVRAHGGLLVTDTTMRDAHQSLLATRVRTHDLVRAAPFTAHALASAASLEVWGGATFDVSLRFLHECPWKRLEQLRAAVPNIPLQMLLRGANAVGYTSYADNVVREFTKEAHAAGVDVFRVFDSLNYLDNMRFGVDAVRAVDGAVAEGTLCYTGDVTSPVGRDGKSKNKYDLEYYVELADELVNGSGVHALAIKGEEEVEERLSFFSFQFRRERRASGKKKPRKLKKILTSFFFFLSPSLSFPKTQNQPTKTWRASSSPPRPPSSSRPCASASRRLPSRSTRTTRRERASPWRSPPPPRARTSSTAPSTPWRAPPRSPRWERSSPRPGARSSTPGWTRGSSRDSPATGRALALFTPPSSRTCGAPRRTSTTTRCPGASTPTSSSRR